MKYILIVAMLFVVCGCASVTHEEITFDKEGRVVKKTKEKYKRVGSQKVGGFKFVKTPEGSVTIDLSKQEGGAGDLGIAVKNATEALVNFSKKGAGGL